MTDDAGGGVPAAPGTWVSRSVEETEAAGAALAASLRAGDVIAISGPLGAGKTRLVAGMARGIGWRGAVRSPTFTLVHEYHGRLTLFHADLYRLETGDVHGLGLEEQLQRGALAVEWGEKLPGALLAEALTLVLEPRAGDRRLVRAGSGPRARGPELLAAWTTAAGATLAAPR